MSPECSSGELWTNAPLEGSLLDADHPRSGVTIARRSTRMRSRPVRGDIRLFDYGNATACELCELKARCTDATSRKVTRYENEAVLDRIAERLAQRPEVLDQRRKPPSVAVSRTT